MSKLKSLDFKIYKRFLSLICFVMIISIILNACKISDKSKNQNILELSSINIPQYNFKLAFFKNKNDANRFLLKKLKTTMKRQLI